MGQKKFLFLLCACSLFSYTPFFTSDVYAFEKIEIAQGDGDPVEVSPEEQLQAAQKLADEEGAETATITAEGDFLLPTYLVKTTENSDTKEETPQIDESPLDESSVKESKPTSKKVVSITKKTKKDLPVVMIKQTELIPVNEQMEVERKLTGSTAQTQKIYNQAVKKADTNSSSYQSNALHYPKKGKPTLTASTNDEISNILAGSDLTSPSEIETGKKKPLLLPLKGVKKPTKKETTDEFIVSSPRLKTYSSAYADKVLEAAQTNQELPLIMPMDLKVSFYPNAADFSGQTIKWLKVFSHKALQDPRYVIEVRLSNENLLLQQKRLFVIQQILANSGLSSHQLVVDYVTRPRDSLVLRMVKKEPALSVQTSTKKSKSVINW